ELPDDVDIDLTVLAPSTTPPESHSVFEPVVVGAPGNGASGNGASGNGASRNGVPANGAAPRSPGLSSILRRNRARGVEPPADEAGDEFLEFLRGALLDDEPLGP